MPFAVSPPRSALRSWRYSALAFSSLLESSTYEHRQLSRRDVLTSWPSTNPSDEVYAFFIAGAACIEKPECISRQSAIYLQVYMDYLPRIPAASYSMACLLLTSFLVTEFGCQAPRLPAQICRYPLLYGVRALQHSPKLGLLNVQPAIVVLPAVVQG
jgi:hypothetical protein